MLRLVPDDVVQLITASGTPAEVEAKVREYVANGATCPILYPLGDDVRLDLRSTRLRMGIRISSEHYDRLKPSVSSRRSIFILILCAALALLVFAVYGLTSATVGSGPPVIPLDDAYIHFQYAHQIGVGQPCVLNPGLPPTQGATSLLYPYLLAVGDVLGLQGLNLGWWAMALGAIALAVSAWLVYRIVLLSKSYGLAVITAAAFQGWMAGSARRFMSGMETGLVILFVLLSFYGILSGSRRSAVLGLTLLALIRPEGGLLAVIGVGALLVQAMRGVPVREQAWTAAALVMAAGMAGAADPGGGGGCIAW